MLTNYIRTKIFLILLGGFLFNSITFAQNILNSNSSQLKPIDGSPPKLDLGAKPPSHVFFSSYLNGQITVLWSPPNLSGKTGPSPHVVGNPSVRNANFCIDCVCPTTGCGKNPVVINLEYLIEESVDGGPFQQIHTLYIGAADTSKYKTERLIIQRPTGNYRFKVKAKYNNYNYNQWPQIHSVSHAVLSTPSIQASGESLVWNAPPANIETELEYAQCSSPCGNIAGSQWHDIEPTSSTSLSLIPFNITHNAFRLRHCKVTGVVSCTNWSPIYKHNIPKANLKQTWVPIAVGDITTFIPVGDASAISEDYNIQLSERDGNRYLTWSTAISATRFQIQGLNKQGQWVTITYTENYGVLIDSSFDNYTKIKVLACNANECGVISNSSEVNIDPLLVMIDGEGAMWQPNRVYSGEKSNFSWRVNSGESCVDESGERVAAKGTISLTSTSQGQITKSITCGNTSFSDTLVVMSKPTLTLPTAIANPVVEISTVVGAIPADFSVGPMGDANYILPIATAAGSGGLVPDVSLSYNSGSGNGILGMGWSISGISSIKHCAKTKVHDNEAGSYDDKDRLCLDGKKLVNIVGEYWAAGTEYQLIDKTPLKIVAGNLYDDKNKYINNYTITQPDGMTSTYTFKGYGSWLLTRKQDLSSNYILYNFYGTRIRSIQYTGNVEENLAPSNEIIFNYQSEDRDDPVHRRHERTIRTLLESIDSTVNSGVDQLRSYQITYKNSGGGVTGRSLIEEITSCANGTCLPATSFGWQEGNLSFSASKDVKIHSNSDSKGQRILDANGDGISDYWLIDNKSGKSSDHIRVVQGGISPKKVQSKRYGATSGFRSSWQVIDFDHDGRDDVIFGSNGWKIYRSIVINDNPSIIHYDFANPISVNIPRSAKGTKVADFNADGLPDVLYYVNDKLFIQYNIYTGNNDGAIFSEAIDVTPPFLEGGFPDRYLGKGYTKHFSSEKIAQYLESNIKHLLRATDLDGDGIAEIIITYANREEDVSSPGEPSQWIKKGHRNIYSIKNDRLVSKRFFDDSREDWTEFQWLEYDNCYRNCYGLSGPERNIHFIDFDQDGNKETVKEHSEKHNNEYKFFLKFYFNEFKFSNDLTQSELLLYQGNNKNPNIPYVFHDYNGDGKIDVLYNLNNDDVWSVYLNNGDGFESGQLTTLDYSYYSSGINTFVEINGDGVADYLSLEGHIKFQVSESKKRDLLTSITDGFGIDTTITYKSLSQEVNSNFYTRENNASDLTDPRCQANGDFCSVILDVKTPLNVVQQVNIEKQTTTSYSYKGLKAQVGVGWLGFSEVKAYEHKTRTHMTSNYHQVFPYTGKLYNTESAYLKSSTEEQCVILPNGNREPHCFPVKTTSSIPLSSSEIFYAEYQNSSCTTEGVHSCTTYNGQYIYPSKLIKNTFNVDDKTLLRTITTENTKLDSYGNIGNVTKKISSKGNNVASVTTEKSYQLHDDYNAYVSLLKSEKVTSTRLGESSVVQAISYEYLNHLLVSKEIDKANNVGTTTDDRFSTNFNSKENYIRDNFGNVTFLTLTGAGAKTQVTQFVYDDYGRYITEQHQNIDYLTRISTFTSYHNILGLPITITSANGQVTTNGYNALGRLNYTYNPNGSYATVTQELCATSYDCPTSGYYVETTTVSNGPNSKAYFNNIGLKIKEKTQNLSDAQRGTMSWVHKNYGYDYLNRKIIESVPYFSGDLAELSDTSTYSAASLPPLGYSYTVLDDYNRVVATYKPDRGLWRTNHNGLTSTSTNPNGMETTTVKNVLGDIVSVTDANSNTVNYTYNALGKMRKVVRQGDSGTVTTDIKFDHLGRKVRMTDPDTGTIQYRYDGLGNLLWQQDAKNQRQCNIYDALGRVEESFKVNTASCSKTASLDAHTIYTFDSSQYGNGLVSSIHDVINGVNRKYRYNKLSQIYRETTTVAGKEYYQDTVYDSNHQFRVSTVYDASRGDSGVQYHYNSANYLVKKTDLASNTQLWKLHKTDAWGNATEFSYNDEAITTTQSYGAHDGTIRSIGAVSNQGSIQNNQYLFDNVGNLEYRYNYISGFEESFTYDAVNRLDDWTKSGSGASGTIDVNYDSLGNISYKTGIGSYHYDNGRAHAVSKISGGKLAGNFAYDANGNMTSGAGRSNVTYNVNNKPTYIRAGGHVTEFVYSIAGSRVVRTDKKDGDTTNTLYIGNVEFVSKNNKPLRVQRSLEGVAIETYYVATQNKSLEFLLFDHLGSAEIITDKVGKVTQRFSFDPWGQRRRVDNYQTSYTMGAGLGLSLSYYTKGYTGHEHLDESGLIHMNGRVYDPRLGRFLSADPMVQQEYNLQNLNRYSYVLNNPLNATDPSGYFWAELFTAVVEYFASDSFAQSVAMAAVSYSQNGDIQFTHSSADAFSYGQESQRTIESQLFDSYDLGGSSRGIAQAKSAVRVSDSVGSGVSGTSGANKAGGGSESNPKLRGSLTDAEWGKVSSDIGHNIENANSALSSLADSSSDGYARLASMYGYSTAEFGDAAAALSGQLTESIRVMGGLLNNRSGFYSYKTGGDDFGEATSQGIGLSNNYFKHRMHFRVRSTIIHEVGHQMGLSHVSGKNTSYGNDRSELIRLSNNARLGYYPPRPDAVALARGQLMSNAYQFEYAVRGEDYRR